MSIIAFVLWAIIVGAIIGALGRLVIPGRNPMGIGLTILLGVVGAIAGGLIGGALGLGVILTFIVEVAIAALLVWLISARARTHHRVM
ncbi:MAG: GlsB/YeaQ/YmgE family stress response membrane protein [Frankiaceae bacterium]